MEEEKLKNVGKRLGSLIDLPDDLKDQLQVSKLDELEQQIIQVINNRYDGVANIDEILVGLYREYGTVHKRPLVAMRLYRMSKGKILHSIPKKKGVYATELLGQ